jgi:hypothetical protein
MDLFSFVSSSCHIKGSSAVVRGDVRDLKQLRDGIALSIGERAREAWKG